MNKMLLRAIWILLILFVVAGVAFFWAIFFSVFFALLFRGALSVLRKQPASEGEFALVAAGMFFGILSTPLSLIPSYKLSIKLAAWMERKWGVRIDNPKKIFWLSLLIPIGVLLILSLF